MTRADPQQPRQRRPLIIQGGMGVGISRWQLAGAVAAAGHLGVVSGTGLEYVYARKLQAGDPGGHIRRAFGHFPVQAIAARVLDRYFVPDGIPEGQRYKGVSMYTMKPSADLLELSMLTNFAEVWLAKERGQGGPVGINYLYKIQLPLLASMFGAVLAGADYVIIGAGNPKPVPEVLSKLARGEDVSLELKVHYADPSEEFRIELSPRALLGGEPPMLERPRFLAIVSSVEQAEGMCRDDAAPDGFVFEAPTAGGHNAPPRGRLSLSEDGEPCYGERDELDFNALRRLERPFWLAGSYGSPAGLERAMAAGAEGIQVGTAFAFCRESGLDEDLRRKIVELATNGTVRVSTDVRASPTGFPFKVVELPDTLSECPIYESRGRICDVGLLRVPFKSAAGRIGYRCPAEPEKLFASKRGRPEHMGGRKCLCNALLANIGLGQVRKDGKVESPLVTAGNDLTQIGSFLARGASSYGACDVIDVLVGDARYVSSRHSA